MPQAKPEEVHPMNENLRLSFVESRLADVLEAVDVTKSDVAMAIAKVLNKVVVRVFKVLNSCHVEASVLYRLESRNWDANPNLFLSCSRSVSDVVKAIANR